MSKKQRVVRHSFHVKIAKTDPCLLQRDLSLNEEVIKEFYFYFSDSWFESNGLDFF